MGDERKYGITNNVKLDSKIPGRRSYVYMDTVTHRADSLFIRAKIPIRFDGKEMHKSGTEYVLVFCRFRKEYESKFLECMADLERAMLLEGHKDYPAFCGETLGMFLEDNGD